MKPIRSFVRRNSKMTEAQKRYFKLHENQLAADHFQADQYIGLEIGFGMGDSLLETARENPDQNWIGIEVFHAGIAAVIGASEREGLTNTFPLEGDVHLHLETTLQSIQFDLIRVFFPDPWPKKRHHKRRLVQRDFVTLIIQYLKVGGILHFASDHKGYAQAVQDLMMAEDSLELVSPPHRPMTKYAKKAMLKGDQAYDVSAMKS